MGDRTEERYGGGRKGDHYHEICNYRSRRNRRNSGILYDESRKRCHPDRQRQTSCSHAGERSCRGKMWDGTTETIPVKAADMDHYSERPDVILVCVKGYSLEDTIPFIQRVANPSTIVIPVLNIYGTGAKMQEKLPNLLVTDGCIYVSANIKEPGVLIQHGEILRVVYGVREKKNMIPDWKKSNRILMSVELTAYCLKISVGMLWRNFPMYLPSVRRDFTIMPRQRTFREKGRNGKLSRP